MADNLRIGRLLLTTTTQPEGAPFIDGACTVLIEGDDVTGEEIGRTTFGALVFGGEGRCLVVGWRDARAPWPGRWWPPRRVLYRWWWVLRGRPTQGVTMDAAAETTDRPDVAMDALRRAELRALSGDRSCRSQEETDLIALALGFEVIPAAAVPTEAKENET